MLDNKPDTMVSKWLRIRLRYFGGVRISRLLAALVLVVVVFAAYRWWKKPTRGAMRYKDVPPSHQMAAHEVDSYLHNLFDTRPQHCRIDYLGQLTEARPTVSILVDFHNTEFYNLKLTLESIMKHTPPALYQEIILVDDGSDHLDIQRHAVEFLSGEKFSRIKAYRSEEHHGRGFTRYKASLLATGSMLVFVASEVVVNVGWLEPLVLAVQEDPQRMVVPHSDNFLSEQRFYQVEDRIVSTFSWPLSTVYMETMEESGKYLRTPIMRGEVMAVTRQFLDTIGNYDSSLGPGGGHDFELSLRAWLCGGEVLMVPCSRIATHNVMKPPVVTSHANYRRISELWLGEYSSMAYKQGRVHGEVDPDERLDIRIRKGHINEKATCKTIDWYFANVATNVLVPPEDMVHYGKMKVSSAYCARVTREMGSDVILVLCRPYMHDASMTFTLDKAGRIRLGDMCLMAASATSRVVMTECQADNVLQKWEYMDTGLMMSQAFRDTCLTHFTTTTQAKNHVHDIRTDQCRDGYDQKQVWTFISY